MQQTSERESCARTPRPEQSNGAGAEKKKHPPLGSDGLAWPEGGRKGTLPYRTVPGAGYGVTGGVQGATGGGTTQRETVPGAGDGITGGVRGFTGGGTTNPKTLSGCAFDHHLVLPKTPAFETGRASLPPVIFHGAPPPPFPLLNE